MKDTVHQPTAKQKQDNYTWFYAALFGGFCLFCIPALAFFPQIVYLGAVFLVFVPTIGIGILVLISPTIFIFLMNLIRDIHDRYWRRTTSKAVPIIVLVIAWLLIRLCVPSDIAVPWIRLQISKPIYLVEIAAMRLLDDRPPHLKTWDWGQIAVFLGGNYYYLLVYDDSGQILLPAESRSADWAQKAKGVRLSHFSTTVSWEPRKPAITKHIDGHFYLLVEQ